MKEKTRLYTYSFVHRRALIQGQDVTWLGRLLVMENRFQAVEHLTVPIGEYLNSIRLVDIPIVSGIFFLGGRLSTVNDPPFQMVTYIVFRSWWAKTTSRTLWPRQRRLCCVGAISSCDEASQKAVACIKRNK